MRELYKFDHSYRRIAPFLVGVDEAGRGPLAGPVVAAAVILPLKPVITLNDSKQLSETARDLAYAFIQRHAISVGVGIVTAEEIDRLNIRQASFESMRRALLNLTVLPQHVLVDGFGIPNLRWPQTAVIGGDGKSACIAAASIVAKVTRDHVMRRMDQLFPGYGFSRHKGYGTSAHLTSLRLLGASAIHRRSFAPVRAVV